MANLPDPRNPNLGIVTGSPILTQYAGVNSLAGSPQQDLTEWDRWRALFQPVEQDIPPMPDPLPDPKSPFYSLQRNLTGEPLQRQRARRTVQVKRHEDAARGAAALRKQQDEQKKRLKELATKYLGREPTPAEMQQLWFKAVDEAEAASLIGIDFDPWQALEAMANSEDAPGVGSKPTTSTSTHTTINLTDPETAKGIIQTSLRDALGRRATDDEVAQFTAALNAAEEANPTVTTTTSTSFEGDTTSESQTTGGAPSPTAVADSWLDDELNAEIDIYRAGTEYFQVAQALAGGVV